MALKVITVDDDAMLLSALKVILESEEIEVVGSSSSALKVEELYAELQPDVLILDIRMPEMNGLDLSRRILSRDPQAKILLLTTFNESTYIAEALAAGCKGYLLKQNFAAVVPAVKAVAAGGMVFDSHIADKMTAVHRAEKDDRLSEREEEIVRLIADGLNNREISEALYLSEGTVRNHISTILSKLQLRDRTQIAISYYKRLIGEM